jgi:hypothetical protein
LSEPRDLVDIAADTTGQTGDSTASGDLVVTTMGDLALAGCEEAIFANVREAVATDMYDFVGAPFFGNYIYLFINYPETKAERARFAAAVRYPLTYNGLVDETSIRMRWLDDGSGEVEFKTVAGTAPKRIKFVEP